MGFEPSPKIIETLKCIDFVLAQSVAGPFEPRCEKTGFRGFRTRSNTNQAVQLQKMSGGLKFRKKRDFTIYVAKSKALISCSITSQLILVFVFAYAKSQFSHNEAHF